MIIRETTDSFIMMKQHDHAYLSGEIMKHVKPTLLKSDQFFDDLILAAYQHDRSWIILDATPIWNDREKKPFSFSDYPLLPKMALYKIGLDEIENMNPYSCLLCSLHFCSFFSQSTNQDCLSFLKEEADRQLHIKKKLPEIEDQLLLQHFRLLQFSDDLSLYMCLNEPGADMDNEHPWFIKGFKHTEMFHPGKHPLKAHWLDAEHVTLDSFPFIEDFQVTLPYKLVSKREIDDTGIAKAYENSELKKQNIVLKR